MKKNYYVCECGKEFTKPNEFNCHKSHCEIHLGKEKLKQVNLNKKEANIKIGKQKHQKNELKKLEELTKWVSEQHTCEKCGKIMTSKFGSGRFCSRACANSREQTPEVNSKRQLVQKEQFKHSYLLNPNYCVICGKQLTYKNRNNKTCSEECLKKSLEKAGKKGGIKSVISQQRRSKNEIYFYELCLERFTNVLHNERMFKNWDADIILPDYKIAILWNGPWHYKQIFKKQPLKQTQSRDKIKLNVIRECGYTPYVIKDLGSFNKKFVEEKFEIFLKELRL